MLILLNAGFVREYFVMPLLRLLPSIYLCALQIAPVLWVGCPYPQKSLERTAILRNNLSLK